MTHEFVKLGIESFADISCMVWYSIYTYHTCMVSDGSSLENFRKRQHFVLACQHVKLQTGQTWNLTNNR